jgi:cholinesterase
LLNYISSGDPKRITIFGESAGGSSVDYYAYAWEKDPIVAGLISQSGIPMAGVRSDQSASWYRISKMLDCGGAESGEKTVDCMRQKSAESIEEALNKMSTGPLSTAFTPVADGKVVFADAKSRGEAGKFARVVGLRYLCSFDLMLMYR